MSIKINIPKDVNYIIEKLYKNGYEAYAVGGCVRDSFLGKEPKDWDITTSASPYKIKELFAKTLDTGLQHGTVTIMINHQGYEVTTYRIDGEYKDSRHPENVVFTSDLREDLKRRDFTINAMAYNERDGLMDFAGGKEDLEKGIIRCVGSAKERFDEDALRILRAIRFSAQLGFDIDVETIAAIREKSFKLKNISAERIKTELDKILMSDNPDRIEKAYEYGITKVIMPEFDIMMHTEQENPNHIYNVGIHTIKAVENMHELIKDCNELNNAEKLMLQWTMLLHDVAKPKVKKFDENNIAHFKTHEIVGKEMAKEIFNRLKFDRYTSDTARALIGVHDYRFTNRRKCMRHAINKITPELMKYIFLVKKADIGAQNPMTIPEKLKDLEESETMYLAIMEEKQCVTLKELAVNGNTLMSLGVTPGKNIGIILNYLLEKVLDEPELNEIDTLKKMALEYIEHFCHK